MNLPSLLGSIAAAILYVGAFSVIQKILDTKRAERRFLPELEKNAWLVQKMNAFISASEYSESDIVELTQSLGALVDGMRSLKPLEQQAILAALRQPSFAGRAAYIGKLVKAIGPQTQMAKATS